MVSSQLVFIPVASTPLAFIQLASTQEAVLSQLVFIRVASTQKVFTRLTFTLLSSIQLVFIRITFIQLIFLQVSIKVAFNQLAFAEVAFTQFVFIGEASTKFYFQKAFIQEAFKLFFIPTTLVHLVFIQVTFSRWLGGLYFNLRGSYLFRGLTNYEWFLITCFGLYRGLGIVEFYSPLLLVLIFFLNAQLFFFPFYIIIRGCNSHRFYFFLDFLFRYFFSYYCDYY